jgi:hypothetical protein
LIKLYQTDARVPNRQASVGSSWRCADPRDALGVETTVYDNGTEQSIAGGSIFVHVGRK